MDFIFNHASIRLSLPACAVCGGTLNFSDDVCVDMSSSYHLFNYRHARCPTREAATISFQCITCGVSVLQGDADNVVELIQDNHQEFVHKICPNRALPEPKA